MLTRRNFLKLSAAAGAGLALPWQLNPLVMRSVLAQAPGGSLDPLLVAKYQAPLVKPPALKRDARTKMRMGKKRPARTPARCRS